jgi:hypothetical protein
VEAAYNTDISVVSSGKSNVVSVLGRRFARKTGSPTVIPNTPNKITFCCSILLASSCNLAIPCIPCRLVQYSNVGSIRAGKWMQASYCGPWYLSQQLGRVPGSVGKCACCVAVRKLMLIIVQIALVVRVQYPHCSIHINTHLSLSTCQRS